MCKTSLCLGICAVLLSGCWQVKDDQQRNYAFQEMRTDIGDLKHALQAHRTELQILQERLSDQENAVKSAQRSRPQNDQAQVQIAACERKMMILEKNLEKLASDLRGLNKHAEQTTTSLASFKEKMIDCQRELSLHKQKLEGVTQLKSTLGQISQAIGERSSSKARSASSYKVRPGDTLEKIAKSNGLSLTTLKRLNNISQDRIIVGQELKLSDDEQ
jgi:LysM repeat protein